MNWYLLGIGIYIVLLVGVSIYASKKVKTGEDFDVAGRSLPYWLLSFTFAGLWFGGGTVIGTTGVAFDYGFWSTEAAWGVIPDPYGAGLCLILAGLFYFTTLRKLGGVTLADFFEARFGKKAALLSTLVMIFGWTFFVAAQIVVFGKIFNSILGWSFNLSIWIGVVLIVLYTIAGGLWSVALTDMVQMIIVLIGIIIAVPIGLNAVGGIQEVKAVLPPEMLSFTPSFHPDFSTAGRWIPWISGWMIIALGSIASPDITQVAQAGLTDKDVKRASVTAGFIYWFFGSLIVLLGLIGAALVAQGTLTLEMLGGDSELIMPVMIQELFPLPLAIIFVSAILAAVMSSADGALLALSTLFSRNILPFFRKASADEKKELLICRLVVVVFAVLTTVIGIAYPNAFLLMNFGFDSLLAGLFVPLTLGIYWKRTSVKGFFAGVISGILVRVVLSGFLEGWTLETVMYPEKWYLYTMIAPLVNLLFTVSVSLLEKKEYE
ncbi:MAG: sodium:solute symporter family protein [Spirochaetales bacterium]|nr:sodium:solute symporter family protein [Spirochaetales bacterium]